MASSDQEEELQIGDEAATPIGPFQSPKRAKTFESGSSSAPRKNLKDIVEKKVRLKKNTYKYQPIDYHEDIRILRLFHGKRGEPLECMLFPSALPSRKNCPSKSNSKDHPYQALSYCWGDPNEEPTHELLIYYDNEKHDGIQKMTPFNPCGKFYVRDNLFAALLQFRQAKEDINLWVDAVCIDQSKGTEAIKEKTAQVVRMNEVYNEAEKVCVWLGKGTPETTATFQFLREILNLNTFDTLIRGRTSPERWYLLIKLLRNQWFSRRWVIQELALAREAVVHWGREKMQWADFADAIAVAMTKHQEIKSILKQARRSELARLDPSIHVDLPEPRALGANTLINASTNLFRRSDDGQVQQRLVDLEVLVSSIFLPFAASEPRDTIYAVLSLAKDTAVRSELVTHPSWLKAPKTLTHVVQGVFSSVLVWVSWFGHSANNTEATMGLEFCTDERITAKYDKRLADVWADFMEYCIERSQSLDIICRHWAPPPKRPTLREIMDLKNSGREHEDEDIPSWVPIIERHAYGGPSGILNGRTNGDSLVGSLERNHQQRYNASGALRPCVVFGKIKQDVGTQKEEKPEHYNTTTSEGPNASEPPPSHAELPLRLSRKFDGTLHVKGFEVATVEKVTGRVLDGVIPEEGLQFGGWLKDAQTHEFPTRVPDRLWRTLVADRDLDGMAAPTWYRRACRECLQSTNANGDLNTKDLTDLEQTPDTMKMFLERMQAVTWCRRFFLTKRREEKVHNREPWYGLGPRDLAHGDTICILFGCSVPVVLRKVQGSDRYTFIGECYVHGIMDGESLPPKQSIIQHPYEGVRGFIIV
ncbi:hypothetical protein G7Y89_g9940 [Cudoniella acicularis]|uniref:Heterokaryon incompatibility domain-containing protein n=1 Tax=Cudoniella acicularis TaxID=354080 RepID=A0A8H4RGG5_9HELO|nr:hypothetical protein G7Y89_g9940 [Cudoniella acicularis]